MKIFRAIVWFIVLNFVAGHIWTEPVSYWWVIEIIILIISFLMVDKPFEKQYNKDKIREREANKMMMNREEMMNNVMRKFGLEAEQTLAFCEIAETWKSDKAVACMYAIAMEMGIDDYE